MILLKRTLLFFMVLSFVGCESSTGDTSPINDQEMQSASGPTPTLDWQGHRGARGLLPENTIPAFLKALEFPALTTLELDVVISQDDQVVVSHEPWMSATICQQPDGTDIPAAQEDSFAILAMTYQEVKSFDCGRKVHTGFPEQKNMPVSKPLLKDVFSAVTQYCTEENRPIPYFNIEIKSQPKWDGHLTPEPKKFAQLVMTTIKEAGMLEVSCIQSFDARSLQAVHALDPGMTTAWLIADDDGLKVNLKELGFMPTIYSPSYKLLSAQAVKEAHALDLKVIPWTVNEIAEMQALVAMGVDGIITDYPNRIEAALSGKK